MTKQTALLLLLVVGCAADGVESDSTAPAQQAENPGDFVLTPSGYYHKDCVFDVGDDATIDEDGTTVTHADGTVEALPACTHPHYSSLENVAAGVVAGSEVEPTYTGWVNDDFKWAGTWFRKLVASWSVPTSPPHYGGQTIFLWPGFEPNGIAAVVQPVLQYGPSSAGGGAYWTIASWYCTSSTCPHSTLKRVSVGDVIEGSVVGSSCTSTGVCTWGITTKDMHSGAITSLSKRDAHPMALAVTTLEVWNLASCNELPSSNAEAFDITVVNANGTTSTSSWSRWKAANMNPSCQYNETSTDHAHTYLFWQD